MFACLVDVELAAKFQDELALETESGETEKVPESLKFFLDNGPFEVQLFSTPSVNRSNKQQDPRHSR